ncbi:MAG: hypothetical protein AAGB11_15405 [Pseudomonadota bacterium]
MLVLPKPGFFPVDGEEGHALAIRLFDQVKTYCGMADWPVLLAPSGQQTRADDGIGLAPEQQTSTLGQFVVDGEGVMITYDPALLQTPPSLISTFAHELAHYLIATAQTPMVCAPDEEEFLTDLAATFLGFGVFLANTRFSKTVAHTELGQGVGWQRSGYLPENDLVFGTAIFLALHDIDPTEAGECLKPHLRTGLRKAVSDLRERDEIEEMRRTAGIFARD